MFVTVGNAEQIAVRFFECSILKEAVRAARGARSGDCKRSAPIDASHLGDFRRLVFCE
jgi:hypothetical protein